MTDRRQIILGAAAGLAGLTGSTSALAAAPGPETKAVELTLLRSLDPDPALAVRFIRANWFAMDAIAKAQGLMTFYTLLYDQAPRDDWNIVVQVGYPDARGFDSIRPAWAKIVEAHKTVLVEGKRLPELARILGTRRLSP